MDINTPISTRTQSLLEKSKSVLAELNTVKGDTKIKTIIDGGSNVGPKPPPYPMRQLKDDEVETILGAIGVVPTRLIDDAIYIQQQQREIVRSQLRGKFVHDHEDIVLQITGALRKTWLKGVITPGTPMGLDVSNDLGAAVMQGTLNIKHKPGSKQNASGGIMDQRQILMLYKRSKPVILVGFKEKQSFRSIMEYWLSKWVEVKINTIVPSIHNVDLIELTKGNNDYYITPSWWLDYINAFENDSGEDYSELPIDIVENLPRYILEYRFDRQQMFNHRIQLANVRNAILADSSNKVHIFFSPLVGGTITMHIVPIVTKETAPQIAETAPQIAEMEDRKVLAFLSTRSKEWGKLLVSGYPDIKFITPISNKVVDAINGDEIDMGNGVVRLHVNPIFIRLYNITGDNIAHLAKMCGLEVANYQNEYVDIVKPVFDPIDWIRRFASFRTNIGNEHHKYNSTTSTYSITVESNEIASQIVEFFTKHKIKSTRTNNIVSISTVSVKLKVIDIIKATQMRELEERTAREEARRTERIETNNDKMSILDPATTPIEDASISWMAELGGGDLRTILCEEGVDTRITFSNNAAEMNAIFGIRAARNFLMTEVRETWINSGAPLQPVSISVIADAMTYTGTLTSSSQLGITSIPMGFLSKMAIHSASTFMAQAAINNETDHLRSSISALMVGKRNKLGVGMAEIVNTTENQIETNGAVIGASNPQIKPIVVEYVEIEHDKY